MRISPHTPKMLADQILCDAEEPCLNGIVISWNAPMLGGFEAGLLKDVVRDVTIIAHPE
jgi:hypothetical protein